MIKRFLYWLGICNNRRRHQETVMKQPERRKATQLPTSPHSKAESYHQFEQTLTDINTKVETHTGRRNAHG